MTIEIDNKRVGSYISGLIERNFESARQFCIAYLKINGVNDPTDEEIRNMANRLSQIKKGNKSIQIYDLPIFSELLNVSYEQILSGGKCLGSIKERLTNYSVSQSHSRVEWVKYIENKDQPILNPDEYGKTILDYAIQFGNYDLIKFLVEKNYIWFDSRKDKDYVMTFGAGTSIQRIKFIEQENGVFLKKANMNDLQYKLATEDQLRMHIISFAADNDDISMLKKLRAREIPELYYNAHYLYCCVPDFDVHYDKAMVSHISRSSNKVLEYFTEPFEIKDNVKYKDGSKRKHTFIFPYISQLLDFMIENNSPYLKQALERTIKHNESTEKKLHVLIKQSVENSYYYAEKWKEAVEFYNNGNIIKCYDRISSNGIITNIAKVTKKSNNREIEKLINELNDSYNRIKEITKDN